MENEKIECVYRSVWHGLIAGVGLWELKHHKSTLSKVLALGLIAFHIDATVCDWINQPTTLQRLLWRLRP
jgi:hypothetical protein